MSNDAQHDLGPALVPGGAGGAPAPQRPAPAYLPWGLFALGMVGFAAFYAVVYRPAALSQERLNAQAGARAADLAKAQTALGQTQGQLNKLRAQRDALARQFGKTEQRRKEAEAALQQLQADLGAALEAEIARGEVLVRTRDGKVVVDLADRLLFDSGEVKISEDGQKLLLQVAPTLLRLPKLVLFQVAGHTDAARVVTAELRERYPTNWELSTARATNVVRFLQERGRVPGNRLVAAGFAKYRPVSSNRTERERAKNRRIEITLVQQP